MGMYDIDYLHEEIDTSTVAEDLVQLEKLLGQQLSELPEARALLIRAQNKATELEEEADIAQKEPLDRLKALGAALQELWAAISRDELPTLSFFIKPFVFQDRENAQFIPSLRKTYPLSLDFQGNFGISLFEIINIVMMSGFPGYQITPVVEEGPGDVVSKKVVSLTIERNTEGGYNKRVSFELIEAIDILVSHKTALTDAKSVNCNETLAHLGRFVYNISERWRASTRAGKERLLNLHREGN